MFAPFVTYYVTLIVTETEIAEAAWTDEQTKLNTKQHDCISTRSPCNVYMNHSRLVRENKIQPFNWFPYFYNNLMCLFLSFFKR